MESLCVNTPTIRDEWIAERAVRRMDEIRWADSIECYFYFRNVQDVLADERTLYERSFGEPFKGLALEYHPFSAKHQSSLHQSGKKDLPAFFLGCALPTGEFGKSILVTNIEELENFGRVRNQCKGNDYAEAW